MSRRRNKAKDNLNIKPSKHTSGKSRKFRKGRPGSLPSNNPGVISNNYLSDPTDPYWANIYTEEMYIRETGDGDLMGFWAWLCCKAIAVVTDPQVAGICGDCHAEGVYGTGPGGGGGSTQSRLINCCGTPWENIFCCPGKLPGLPLKGTGPGGKVGHLAQTYTVSKNPEMAAHDIVRIAQSAGDHVDYNDILGKLYAFKNMSGNNVQPMGFMNCNGCGNSKPGLCLWNGSNSSGCANGIIKISVKFK